MLVILQILKFIHQSVNDVCWYDAIKLVAKTQKDINPSSTGITYMWDMTLVIPLSAS